MQFIASTEILGAILSASVTDVETMVSDPRAYISRVSHVEVNPEVDIKVVQNDTDEVNLTLPYYSGVTRDAAVSMSDDEIFAVSGGYFNHGSETLSRPTRKAVYFTSSDRNPAPAQTSGGK